jgi:DNA-directed RNA polymerase specialized sigma24 family protein
MDPDPDQISDEQILTGLQGGEQTRLTALRRAMEKYTYRLGGLARNYLGASEPHDVVDVVDRTFQALWESHQAIEGSLRSWLARVAVNQSITLVRQRTRRHKNEPVSLQDQTESGLPLEDSGELMLIAQGIEDPWSGMVFEEYISQFAACIGKLPPAQKAVGSVMLEAAKQSGELPHNEDILKEVRRLTGNPSFSLEAVKSAKKQVLAKLRPTIARCEKREQRPSAP